MPRQILTNMPKGSETNLWVILQWQSYDRRERAARACLRVAWKTVKRWSVLSLLISATSADEWTGKDKDGHVAVGLAIGATVRLAAESDRLCADWPYWKKSLASLAVVAAVAGGKEISDKRTGGDPSWKDFTVTLGGGLIGDSVIGGMALSISDDSIRYSCSWRF